MDIRRCTSVCAWDAQDSGPGKHPRRRATHRLAVSHGCYSPESPQELSDPGFDFRGRARCSTVVMSARGRWLLADGAPALAAGDKSAAGTPEEPGAPHSITASPAGERCGAADSHMQSGHTAMPVVLSGSIASSCIPLHPRPGRTAGAPADCGCAPPLTPGWGAFTPWQSGRGRGAPPTRPFRRRG